MLFEKNTRDRSAEHRRTYAIFELFYTVIDFAAAFLFIIGSIMFFSEAWTYTGTWLFLIGSIFFAMKPALRLIRELKLAAIGDTEDLAERFKS